MHMSTGQLIHSVWPDPSLKMLTVYKIVSFLIIEKIEINKTNKCRWIVLAQQWEIEQSQRDKQEWKCPWQWVKRRLESLFMYLGVGRLPIKSRSKILRNTRIRKIIFLGPFVTQSRSKILMNGRIRKCVKSFINKVVFYSHRIALDWDSCSSGWRRVFLLQRILLCIFQTSTAT